MRSEEKGEKELSRERQTIQVISCMPDKNGITTPKCGNCGNK